MLLSFRSLNPKRSFLIGILFSLFIFYPLLLSYHTIHPLVASHVSALDHAHIFASQFRVYILTHACGRFTSTLSAALPSDSVVLVPDVRDAEACEALKHEQLHTEPWPVATNRTDETGNADDAYRSKYAQVLWHCRSGGKMKCLLLEDDVVLLHSGERTREVLVEQTLSLFNNEDAAYDCTKRGFGWLPSKSTGNGSQCRIFSKTSAECLVQCLTQWPHKQVDYGLGVCQTWCGLQQKRFLLAVHGGLSSTMAREGVNGTGDAVAGPSEASS